MGLKIGQGNEARLGGSLAEYRRHFVYPLTVAMTVAGLVMVALLVWLTVKFDAQEAARETELAHLVISSRLDFMSRNQSDYATWDDAVAKLVLSIDSEWASDNIGPYLFHTQGYEHSFVIDGRDRTVYASDRERQARLDPFEMMGPTLKRAIAELRTKPVGEDHRRSGLVLVNGRPAAFSIAAIIPDPGKVKLPSGPASYLLFIDVLTPEQLAGLGTERRLIDMRFLRVAPKEERTGSVALLGFDGVPIGHMVWTLQQPGSAMRRIWLPALLAFLAILAVVSAGILRRCRRAIEQTDAAVSQSAADATEARQALEDLTRARADAARADAESYRRFRRMALHDGLTNLPNRMYFNEELQRKTEAAQDGGSMAVVMLDLARFKAVNDTHGHQAGDQLLVMLAERFSAVLQPGEFIARLGGDEFAAVKSYDRPMELSAFLGRIRSIFDAPFAFVDLTLTVCANIGVVVADDDALDPNALLARADLAMYRAKQIHSADPCFYDAKMDDAVRFQRELTVGLRDAVKGDAFELHYQVQAAVQTGDIIGYEALVRWRHPTRGLIPPATFIPLAEEIGEIVPLSKWILQQACFEAALWPNRYPVSVNLSPLHLADTRLVETVRSALDASGLASERLCLELTESAIIKDRRFALQQLQALKAMGVAIALDDFGAGYSSLDVLRSFPFDRIKLDASFVADIENDEQAVSILRSVTALGSTLHMPVLAEAIEHPAQLAIVSREGCSAIQGYLIGRPSRTLASPDHVRQVTMRRPAAIAENEAAA